MANDNKLLGQFDLVGIPPAPRGVPQIEVTFDIDANGIVHVSAKDMGTQKEQSIQITASSGLSDEEIDRLVKEGEAHAEEDKKKKELVEVRNEADTLIYTTEKSLGEFGDKVSEDEKSTIETELAACKKAIEGDSVESIRSAIEALSKASHKLAEEMYKKTAAEQAEAGPSGETGETDDSSASEAKDGETVVDAEFEETDKTGK
ncbi:MAG: Hsp70 family protein, partial [Nitrospiria bacterium]